MNKIRHIIWDWNGTLINDAPYCHTLVTRHCEKYGFPTFEFEEYQRKLCHPVSDFYRAVGFDLDKLDFEALALEFHDWYEADWNGVELYPDTVDVLAKVQRYGVTQSILSAHPHELLERNVGRFEIRPYFSEIVGLNDSLGSSKVALAKEWHGRQSLSAENFVLIGDTDHDIEVARALGIRCVAISRGFQSKERLEVFGVPVVNSLSEALEEVF
jgi:phosphoglycolate phosphatase